jgi:hypothetical protein
VAEGVGKRSGYVIGKRGGDQGASGRDWRKGQWEGWMKEKDKE